MATKYAVVGGLWSDTATWSDSDGGAGGATVPADDDAVVISANVSVLMDVDQSLFANGIAGMTIRSHATTPGMLYFKDGTDGYLKIKTGTYIQGTNVAAKGRILANSDGVWGNTGSLAVANTATIMLNGSAYIAGLYLNVELYCAQPTTKVLTTYGSKVTVAAVDTGTNRITTAVPHGFTTGMPVMFQSSGTLPSPLEAHIHYRCVVVNATTFTLQYDVNMGTLLLSSAGTGTIEVYNGSYDTASAVLNVFEDVTSESDYWRTDSGRNAVVVSSGTSYSKNIYTLANITSTQITLSSNLWSAIGPDSRIVLTSRNVRIWNSTATATVVMVSVPKNSVYQCEIRCLATGTRIFGGASGSNCVLSGVYSNAALLLAGTNYSDITFSGIMASCGNGNYYSIGAYIFSGEAYGVGTVIYTTSVTIKSSAICIGSTYTINSGYFVLVEGGWFVGEYIFRMVYCLTVLGGRFLSYYMGQSIYKGAIFGGNCRGCALICQAASNIVVYGGVTLGGQLHIVDGGGSLTLYDQNIDQLRHFGRNGTLVLNNSNLTNLTVPGDSVNIKIVGHNSSIENYEPASSYLYGVVVDFNQGHVFFDYGGVKGALKARNGGGKIDTVAYDPGTHGTPPVTLTQVYENQFLYEQLNGIDLPLAVQDGVMIVAMVYMKKSVNGMTVTPYVEICDTTHGFNSPGEQLAVATMEDNTDWQTLTVSYRPTDNRPLVLRVAGQNSSGTLFWNWEQVNVSETKLIDSTVYDSVIY